MNFSHVLVIGTTISQTYGNYMDLPPVEERVMAHSPFVSISTQLKKSLQNQIIMVAIGLPEVRGLLNRTCPS